MTHRKVDAEAGDLLQRSHASDGLPLLHPLAGFSSGLSARIVLIQGDSAMLGEIDHEVVLARRLTGYVARNANPSVGDHHGEETEILLYSVEHTHEVLLHGDIEPV
jgi:hypothetical protein